MPLWLINHLGRIKVLPDQSFPYQILPVSFLTHLQTESFPSHQVHYVSKLFQGTYCLTSSSGTLQSYHYSCNNKLIRL